MNRTFWLSLLALIVVFPMNQGMAQLGEPPSDNDDDFDGFGHNFISFGTVSPAAQFMSTDLSEAGESPYFDGIGGSWTIAMGSILPFGYSSEGDPSMVTQYKLANRNIGLCTGFMMDYSRFPSKETLEAANGVLGLSPADTIWDVRSNSVDVGYMRIPFLLHLGSSLKLSEPGLHAFIGVVPGIRYTGQLRSRLQSGETTQVEWARNFGLRRFQVNARVSVGSPRWELFAEAALLSMFRDEPRHPQVYPLALGLSYSP